MTTWKRIGLILGIAVGITVIPPLVIGFVYDAVTGNRSSDHLGWLGVLCMATALLVLFGGTIYIAVEAAIRNNRQRNDTTPPH